MPRNYQIARAVRCALVTSAAAAATLSVPVDAQEQPTPDQPAVSTVVVTGSRIVAPNLESISPVTTITTEDIQNTGKVRIEDIVNQLPQAFAAQGSSFSNGASGAANVDLRNLDPKRTLVLVNGRRLMPGNPDATPIRGAGAADLNQIPAALIRRVEVLTGGASSVYGADAIAGVVNFIMDTEFQGVRVDANYNFNTHKNDNAVADVVRDAGFDLPKGNVNTGYSRDFTFLAGSNFADDRGNATFYATYRKVDAVLQSQFDFSACTLNSGDTFSCGGSLTAFPGRMRPKDPVTGTRADLVLDASTGNMRPINTATDVYNFGPLNYYQRPDERYTAGAFLNLNVADEGKVTSKVYGEFMFMNDQSVSQIAPSGAFGTTAVVHCNNPLWNASQQQAFCGQFGLDTSPTSTDTIDIAMNRRNVEGGGRQNDINHESYRAVLGVKGDIGPNWNYDAYGHYGTTQLSAIYLHDMSDARIARSLDAVRDPATGQTVCQSVLDGTDPNCVPWNIWQVGNVTPEALNYVEIPLVQRGSTTERVVNASVTGDLGAYGIKLPTAETGLFVNVGLEWRSEDSQLVPDAAFQAGDGAGQGGPTLPISGSYTAREAFTEARMAFVEDRTALKSLSGELGYRWSDYSLGFKTDTYKAGLEWTPYTDLKFRGSYQRAVRVPGVTELFSTHQIGLDGVTDLCAGATPTFSAAECARTGVLPSEYGTIVANPAAQYNGFIGGNVNLQPEKADTYSFGLAYQPSFVPGLRVQIDYYDIKIKDAIQNPNADFTQLQCIRGNDALCAKIHRDHDEGGTLWDTSSTTTGFIDDLFENIGGLHNTGVDFDVGYNFEIGKAGRMRFALNASRLQKAEVTPQPGVTYDCAGLYGSICLIPFNKWRHRLMTNWSTPWHGADLTLVWRYFSEVKLDGQDSNQFLALLGTATGPLPTDAKLGARGYLDLSGSMSFAEKYTVRLGVSNLLDKDPPLNGAASCPSGPCNGNTWPQVYDTLGRQIFIMGTARF